MIGHSERRTLFGETNAQVQQKVQAAFEVLGLLPILCIGETLEEREAGNAESIVQEQLLTAMESLQANKSLQSRLPMNLSQISEQGRLRRLPKRRRCMASFELCSATDILLFVADDIRIQYGGSVKPHNAQELLSQPDIDGALVGGASLTVDSFIGT